MNIVISVITPFYYGNKYISTLYDILSNSQQKLREYDDGISIEWIIVNDSPEAEVSLGECDRGLSVRVVTHEINKGIHQARITGLQCCNGGYVKFLDQDDIISDSCLLEEFRRARTGNIVVSNAILEKADGKRVKAYRSKYEFGKVNNLLYYAVAHNIIVSPGQCLIPKDLIPNEWCSSVLDENGSDDLLLWVMLLSKGERFQLINQCLYTHIYTGSNLSEARSKMNYSTLQCVRILNEVPYVDQRIVRSIYRSRMFEYKWDKSVGIRRLGLLMSNPDIIVIRVAFKFMTTVSIMLDL